MFNQPLAGFLYIKGLIPESASLSEAEVMTGQFEESLLDLVTHLQPYTEATTVTGTELEHEVQSVFYESGKIHFSANLRFWFKALYQIFLSQEDGPRLGEYALLRGINDVIAQIDLVTSGAWFYRKM